MEEPIADVKKRYFSILSRENYENLLDFWNFKTLIMFLSSHYKNDTYSYLKASKKFALEKN